MFIGPVFDPKWPKWSKPKILYGNTLMTDKYQVEWDNASASGKVYFIEAELPTLDSDFQGKQTNPGTQI